MSFGADTETDGLPPVPLILGILLAFAVSVGFVWLAAGTALAAAAYGGALIVVVLTLLLVPRYSNKSAEEVTGQPDWSVTAAAIQNRRRGVAVVDRANRLTCANSTYERWFGADLAPHELPFSEEAKGKIAEAARQAWREGHAECTELELSMGEKSYSLVIERVGRGEDFLVWRFGEILRERTYDGMQERIAGPLGHIMSRSGIELALVAPDGIVQVATPGLGERATGTKDSSLAGQEFVQLLRSDDRDRIFFAREGQQGSPQTLVHIPLDPPTDKEGEAAPSLMLLVDSTVGIGGGWQGSGKAAIPQLEALLSALPLGLALTDRDGRFLFANKAFLRAVEREELGLPQFPSDLVVREDKAAMADTVRRFAKGATASGDMAVRLANDKEEPVSIGLAGVRGLGDAAVLLSISDSTEEKRLRRQVAQATKMQAVGQLAGGVAHDFNNVLTAIIGYCDLMLLRHTPGDSDYDDIQQIKANSNRAASLTRQLLAFSRQQTLRPVVLQMPDVVSEVSQLLKRLMGDKIEFSVRHDRELGPVRADPQQLEQVIINLAVNARDAMQSHAAKTGKQDWKGRLTLATRRVSARDVRKMGIDIMPADDYTVLIVQDTGGGIPAEHLNKIFEPFFTTKEQGKGTGLGLSTVYGIVKQSNGFIFADNVTDASGEAAGARFTVYLPVHKGEIPASMRGDEPEEAKASEWSGGGKLLLVEDEDMVRAVAERALVRAGYTVTTARDGEEGLAQVANGDVEFDLIVSDVVMPAMDGPAMARAVRKVKPKIPILFMSGYAEEQLRNDIDIDNMHFIPKPFSVQQINAKVSEVLGEQAKVDA
ncbi:hybrid sensor histidine kinase/response regulator [Qipengyuania sphaerica]|uniref:hybrid sensor histidine kinase/response regulator n=1 Tax=Qipengyuania sphaerica TaxID=2867243 RepID=UPI001C87C311|nr:response regulator [Qipengyuania sphaerica]MBX7540838.1 response regulator [Qipengyuania sphaerica]